MQRGQLLAAADVALEAAVTWNTPWNLNARLTWRYFSSVYLDTNSSQSAADE